MDDIISIEKYNNTYFKIHCNEEQTYELYSYFECLSTGYQFDDKFRAGHWNGKISFFNKKAGNLLPIGLLNKLVAFAKEFHYQLKLDFDIEDFYNDIEESHMKEFYNIIFNNVDLFPRDYQHECIYTALKRKRGVIESATGCHEKGTKILLNSGEFKNVEDIVVGDILMGVDEKRTVLKIISGNEKMFKIIPKKGNSFVVNENHILHLKFTNGRYKKKLKKDFINISVSDYLKQNNQFKHETKLVFNNKELVFDNDYKNSTKLSPYFVGLYLGDGHVHRCGITTMDNEIIGIINEVANLFNSDITINKKFVYSKAKSYFFTGFGGKQHPIIEEFRKLGLNFGVSKKFKKCSCGTKFIPDEFKYGSIDERYNIIAGLIDSDGYLGKSYYDFCVKSKQLCDDFVFICRSLGFYVSCKQKIVNGCVYYRCCVQGDIGKIPCKIKRKQFKNELNRNKSVFVHGFDIECVGEDDFYGFSLDGDKLYFTDDFCIHHNSGKSLVIYSLIRFIMSCVKRKILLVVPNVSLTMQMFNDFSKDYGWEGVSSFVSVLHHKSKRYDPEKPILISTWQSIYKNAPEFFSQFDAVIVDEVHSAKSISIQTILKHSVNAEYRIGLTGTLPEDEIDLNNIFGFIGPKLISVKSEDLIDKGFLSKIIIANLLLQYPKDIIDENKKRIKHKISGDTAPYKDEYDFIINYPERNKVFDYIIKNINTSDNVLILCERIDHLKLISEHINGLCGSFGRKMFMIHGSVDANKREEIRQFTEKNNGVVIVATYGTMSTGVNIKKLHHIIAASSYKSKIKVLQSIGRGMRLHDSKNKMVWWDIVDDMRWEKRKRKDQKDKYEYNYMFKQFLTRLRYYNEQNFNYLNKTINLTEIQ